MDENGVPVDERDPPFDPDDATITDGDVLELLEPAVREWWVEEFGEFVPENDGFFTPPQEGAIPLVHEGTNALIAAPTGSGKCVKPDTPLIVRDDETAKAVRAEELLDHRTEKLADVDEDGELFASNLDAYSLSDGEIETRRSHVYSESYEGELQQLRTVYGREVEVTPDHPLLVETGEGPEWKRAAEITEGDRIGVPAEIDLPSNDVKPNIDRALDALRERFPLVVTGSEAERVISELDATSSLESLSEDHLRKALALADLSMPDAADRLSIGLASVHNVVTRNSNYELEAFVELLLAEVDPLGDREILVKTDNGKVTRLRHPSAVDEDIALFSAFVLAEGFIGEYERSAMVSISQTKRTDLLERTLTLVKERFGVDVRQRGEKDYYIGGSVFAVFVSAFLDLSRGPGREVRFPDWVLNAPDDVKRTFVSTFLSLEGEVRENEIRVVQSNEMKIEQLNYLLLSFGILPSRRPVTKYATNTDHRTEREYYELTVRGRPNLERILAEFDVAHQNIDETSRYADGGTSGTPINKYSFDYRDIRNVSHHFEDDEAFDDALGNVYEVARRSGHITDRALDTLSDVVEGLPEDDTTTELSDRIAKIRQQNVSWLEVKEKDTVSYDGEIIDLSVPDTHNFVGGRGAVYLHNTLASFTSIINELFRREKAEGLENSVYCLYVSPLKSLANDIHRNLEVPLDGITGIMEDRDESVDEVRHAIRHGDTSDSERQKMLRETPHILNTTPETLAILLNSPKFREKLRTVEYVVVDEIHSIADGKRGTHLSVSLERLERIADSSPTRIGCSATIEPLSDVAEFLVGQDDPGGTHRDYEIVDARFAREFDIELHCPTDDLINTPREVVQSRFYDELHDLIRDNTNTLVFTNTRSGAERVLQNLRERFDAYDEGNSGCHHGSLSKEARQDIEGRLKDGTLDVVTSSTSLELGIDMPHVDMVVQVGSPKSVAALLQRVGRAGHRVGQTVTGRVVALDRDELVECAVMLKKAEEGFVDSVSIPENAQDVATQHVYGMAINEVMPEPELRGVLQRAYPYRNYGEDRWEQLMRYLTADYEGLEDKNVYAKVWRDGNDPPDGEHHYEDFPVGELLIGKRGRLARVIYMTNIGTIPDSFTCDVYTRGSNEWVGNLDENYLDTLEKGDVFVLGGRNFQFSYRRGSKVYVDRTSARPTVPSWFSERLPLSYDLGREILAFQGELVERLEAGGAPAVRRWLREYPLDDDSVRAIARMFDQQTRYAGPESVSTDERIAVEEEKDRDEYERHYYVHSNYGRRFNDGLSRVLAYRCAQETNANVSVAVADNGFTLSMPLNRKVDVAGVLRDLNAGDVRSLLRESIGDTELLQRYFRINATRSLMILKRYKGYEKSAQEQQVSSEMLLGFAEDLDDFAVIEETYREILEDKLNVAGIEEVVAAIGAGEVTVAERTVASPSPRAFGLATLMASDVVLADDESAALQAFHERVVDAIGDEVETTSVLAGDE